MSELENSSTTKTSVICDLHAQGASSDECVISIINTEDSDMIETSAVYHLSAHRASHNEDNESVMSEISDTTRTSAVCHLHAQEANCVMSERIDDVTEVYTVQCLSA